MPEYVDLLSKNSIDPREVFLFGSFARGKAKSDSDIDVAVVSESLPPDRFEARSQLMHLRWNIDLQIEPHPFRPEDFTEDNPEAAEIIPTGIKII